MKRSVRAAVLVTGLLGVTGCGTATFEPVVDPRGVDMGRYQMDVQECKALAEKVGIGESAVTGTFLGALAGAVIGAATGAVFGDPGLGVTLGTAAGGTSGLVGGAGKAGQDQERVMRNCLAGRGYRVLN